MSIKDRVSNYLKRLLKHYGATHDELSGMLETRASTLQGWLSATNMPGIEALSKIAMLGGITVDELITSDDPSIGVNSGIVAYRNKITATEGSIANVGNVSVGSLNPWVPPESNRVTKEELNSAQIKNLRNLVDQIVEKEEKHKKRPRSYGAIWRALNRRMKVRQYWEIPARDYDRATRFLNRWLDRLNELADESTKPDRK